jgi:uncharacterized protein YcfJ
MNRIALSVLTLAISAVAGSAFAGAQDYGNNPRYDHGNYDARTSQRTLRTDRAQVLRVEEVGSPYGSSTYERQECWNEQTNGYEGGYYRDSNGRLYRGDGRTNTNGMIVGALIGGALGSTVGKGDGRTAATIGGAVIGGAIGAHAGNDHNDYQYRDDSGVVRRCRTVVTTDNNGGGYGGYNVTYRYAGQTYQAFTNQRPGRYIDVTVDVRPRDDNSGYRH